MRNSGSCNTIKTHIPEKLHSKISLNFCPTILFKNHISINVTRNTSVGFLLAGDRLSNRHKDLENFVTNIQEFKNYLQSKGIKTILINHQNDTWISEFIEFDETKDLYKKSVEEIYNFYSSIDTVIADRGHGQMIPLACGCKVLSPVSHQKLAWFLNDLELSEFYIDENDPHLGKLLIKKYQSFDGLNWNNIYHDLMNKIKSNYDANMNIIKLKLLK